MGLQRIVILGCASIIVVGGLVFALTQRNFEFLYYGATLIAIALGIALLDHRVRLPIFVLWGFLLWLVLHLAGGMVRVPESAVDVGMTNYTLYNVRLAPWLPRYDQFVHALGFGVSTLAAWRALYVGSKGVLRPTLGPLLAAGLIGMGCGATNEVIEFIATRIMPDTNVGGFVNTGWDLVSNGVGCVLGAMLVRARHAAWFTQPVRSAL